MNALFDNISLGNCILLGNCASNEIDPVDFRHLKRAAFAQTELARQFWRR